MQSKWPIVSVKTVDGYQFHGLYSPIKDAKCTLIHVHGTGGAFFWNKFHPTIVESVNAAGLSYLSTNNRGSGIYELELDTQPAGISLEIFEESIKDIDTWIEFALTNGSTSVILEGHSFGVGKTTYYMAKGKYRDKVKGVIHLGTNGVYQTQQKYLKEKNVAPEKYLAEAQSFADAGKLTTLLADPTALCGYYPASAQTYLNFFTPGSSVFRATQMATMSEGGYRHEIKTSLLWILGDNQEKEYLFVPFEEAFRLVRSENPQVEIYQIKDCDHGFNGHEEELASLISTFLTSML